MRYLLIAGLLLCLACAPTPSAPDDADADAYAARDPLEALNRPIFALNLMLDRYALRHVATLYRQIPLEGRLGIRHMLANLGEPANMLNSLLQRDPERALTAFWRFTLNSSVGFLGWRDFAGENGLTYENRRFASTLEAYGMGEGNYLVLPLFGPSHTRERVGLIADWFTDPLGFALNWSETLTYVATNSISRRDEQDKTIRVLYYQSLDPYTATRAAYLQNRLFKQQNGKK